jgi:very-short-patch-repair endonuclease
MKNLPSVPAGMGLRWWVCMENKHNFYNKSLKSNANKLRHNMTKAESCLWKYVLSAGKLDGNYFRRQRPVLNYIADLMCINKKLIIEVDGATHNSILVRKNDDKRQLDLENLGFTLIRFTDDDVLNNLSGVRIKILEVLRKL